MEYILMEYILIKNTYKKYLWNIKNIYQNLGFH